MGRHGRVAKPPPKQPVNRRSAHVYVNSTCIPTTVAINGNALPTDLVDALDSGRWVGLSVEAGRFIQSRFGTRTLFPDLYDYVQIVRTTDFFVSDAGAGYWPGGIDRSLDMDPSRSVLIGDVVGAGEDFLALDYRSESPSVRFLDNTGWVHVADSITELMQELES